MLIKKLAWSTVVPFFLTVVCTLLASLPVKADCIIPVEQTRDVSSWGNIISIGHGGDGQELYDAAPDFGPFYIFQPMALIYEMASIDSNAWQHSTTGDNLLVVKCGSVGGTSAGQVRIADNPMLSECALLDWAAGFGAAVEIVDNAPCPP